MFVLKADKKHIELKTNIDKDIPKNFTTDPQMIKQIIVNLVGNSLKYTFKGSITISAKLIIDNADYLTNEENFKVKITVEDTGIGIKKEDF